MKARAASTSGFDLLRQYMDREPSQSEGILWSTAAAVRIPRKRIVGLLAETWRSRANDRLTSPPRLRA